MTLDTERGNAMDIATLTIALTSKIGQTAMALLAR
jgi:hypothetical protein